MNEDAFTVPRASSEPLPELAAFLRPFAPLFRYRQSWHSVERYLTGLLTDLPRKNCQTIAAAVAGTSTERLQHLLTDATWDPHALDQARVQLLSAQSPAGGIVVLEDTGLPKQGPAWAGLGGSGAPVLRDTGQPGQLPNRGQRRVCRRRPPDERAAALAGDGPALCARGLGRRSPAPHTGTRARGPGLCAQDGAGAHIA
jgi:hypothetical protein